MRAAMSEEVVSGLLRRVPLFASLAPSDLRALAASAHSLSRKKGARIFEEGSSGDSCYILTSGRAKVVLSGPAATELILGTVEPFELVGELALIDSFPRSAGLVATEDSQLIQLPGAAFRELRKNRSFEDQLVAHVAAMLRGATEQLRAIYTYSSSERVAWCLARLGSRKGRRIGDAIVISPRPAHQELADMTGCTRETVTRILRQLKQSRSVAWDDQSLRLSARAFKRYLQLEDPSASSEIARVV